ncbi:MAG: hypothetical protein U1E17_01765 [Geminicoccaceae bacterium]
MRRPLALAACMLATSCAHYKAENKPLYAYPGIQAQIENYYDDNAVEDDWECTDVQMDNINDSKVVKDTGSQVKIAVNYYFSSADESQRQGGNQCQGFETRYFTFDKSANGQLTLTGMSGSKTQP